MQGLPLQAPVWTAGAEGAHEWIQRFSCASDQGSHCFPPTIWHASPHFSENLLFLHTIAFSSPPPRSPYGYKWDQGGEHYTLSNGLPCIWKAKPRGLYNQANMQTNWNYNGTLEYIPEVFKPQRRKKIPSTKLQGADRNPQKLGNTVRSDWKLVLTSPLRKRVERIDNIGCFLVGLKHTAELLSPTN